MTDRAKVTYELRLGCRSEHGGEPAAYEAEGETDTLLVTMIDGNKVGRRQFTTSQYGPDGKERFDATLFFDLGVHFLATAIDVGDHGGLTEVRRSALRDILHQLRKV